MKYIATFICAALVAIIFQQAEAQNSGWSFFMNASWLKTECSSYRRQSNDACEAYIAGVFDALNSSHDLNYDARSLKGCRSKKISTRDARLAVVNSFKKLFDGPDPIDIKLTGPASRSVVASLSGELCKDWAADRSNAELLLGPEPRKGTREWLKYQKLKTCLVVFELPLNVCRNSIQ